MAHALAKPSEGTHVRLRSGLKINRSENVPDYSTAMVVFVREDYAGIPLGGTVVDVGAYIGAFTLYAIQHGAARVISFEPAESAFGTLTRNITENSLSDRVDARRRAIVGTFHGDVLFPDASSPMNRLQRQSGNEGVLHPGFSRVPSSSFSQIIDEMGSIDLLKLDCEGAEYDIIFSTPKESWQRVSSVALEYHDGRVEDLVVAMVGYGFVLTRHAPDPLWTATMGMLCLDLEGAPSIQRR